MVLEEDLVEAPVEEVDWALEVLDYLATPVAVVVWVVQVTILDAAWVEVSEEAKAEMVARAAVMAPAAVARAEVMAPALALEANSVVAPDPWEEATAAVSTGASNVSSPSPGKQRKESRKRNCIACE